MHLIPRTRLTPSRGSAPRTPSASGFSPRRGHPRPPARRARPPAPPGDHSPRTPPALRLTAKRETLLVTRGQLREHRAVTSGARQLAPGECRRVDGCGVGTSTAARWACAARSVFLSPTQGDKMSHTLHGVGLRSLRIVAALLVHAYPWGRPRSWWRLRLRRPPPAAVSPATSACDTSPATTAGCTSTRARTSGLTTTTSRTPTRTPSPTTTPSRRSITAPRHVGRRPGL